MENSSRQKSFRKNLNVLQKFHPLLATQITLTDPEDLEFCLTRKGEPNLKRIVAKCPYFYHSPLDARQEAIEWFESLDLHLATVIFVYGIGLGYYYEAAKHWLKKHPHHRLVFLEQDAAVIHRLCETELGTLLLKDPQIRLHLFQDPLNDIALFNDLSWSYHDSAFVITSLKLYQEADQKGFLQLQQQILYAIEQKKAFIDEYLNYGLVFFRNFYPNLLELPRSFWGNGLYQCFRQIPAIICGAGPSLSKNIDLLKGGIKDRALIFAGGSALNALIPHGIVPHFGVAIDPNKEQYSRIVAAQEAQIPIFYRNRLFHEALAAITGPRLFLTGAGGYDTARWFEQELTIEGEDLEEGHNVVNFSLQIAQALGCNPIILVGVDLALSNERFYADGIAANLNLDEESLKKKEAPDTQTVLEVDIHGKPVYTLWKWIAEGRWISKFAQLYPEIDIVNATEGGLGFEGIPNLTLEEAIKRYVSEPQEAIKKIDEIIQAHALNKVKAEKILELIQKMKESLNHCVILLSKLIEECCLLDQMIEQEGTIPSDLHTPHLSLLEGELEAEVGYQYVLAIFHQVFLHIRHRTFQDLQSPKLKLSEKEKALKTVIIHKQKWIFLRDVAQVNRELIQHTMTNYPSISSMDGQ